MNTTTTTEPAGKRARNGSVILTDRMCEKRVAKRAKIYDRKCPGFYVSITTAGIATFSFKFTDRTTGRQRTGWLGIYNPETFTVEHARSRVYGLKSMDGAALAETFRERTARQAKQGKTVDAIIKERIEWMKTPVRKPDGAMRPRIETGQMSLATCGALSVHGSARSSPARSPSTTLQRCRTTSSLAGTAVSHRSPTPATCAARPRACSTGRRKRAATT